MFLLDVIDPTIFLISFAVSMFFGYMFAKTPRIVYKYPTPYNVDTTIYTDNAGICYKYNVNEVQCPSDITQIQPVYFQ